MPGFTRQIILHTLTELMNEKPLSKITVKDIVERCGVNRNTFYYHFRDIPVPLDPEGCICRLSGSCRRACGGGADQQGGRRLRNGSGR